MKLPNDIDCQFVFELKMGGHRTISEQKYTPYERCVYIFSDFGLSQQGKQCPLRRLCAKVLPVKYHMLLAATTVHMAACIRRIVGNRQTSSELHKNQLFRQSIKM